MQMIIHWATPMGAMGPVDLRIRVRKSSTLNLLGVLLTNSVMMLALNIEIMSQLTVQKG